MRSSPENLVYSSKKIAFPRRFLSGLVFLFLAFSTLASDHKNSLIQLPEAVSNNAVTSLKIGNQYQLFSFNGLGQDKNYQAIHARAFSINLQTEESKIIAPLTDGQGRLASVAVSLKHKIFVIGGYTVAADGHEVSTDEIYRYDEKNNRYHLETRIPVAVDDSLALVYQDRYIYLVSGWSQHDNVALVQVYDSLQKSWFKATPFPGDPVFGHAGGIVANQLLVVDGVKIIPASTVNGVKGPRQFVMSQQSWQGTIDVENPAKITWRKIAQHPGPAGYRMASAGIESLNLVLFAGGSNNPYNYNGIGYDGQPSKPSASVFSYHFSASAWHLQPDLGLPSMDHRGLALSDKAAFILGGLGNKRQTLNSIQAIPFSQLKTLQPKGIPKQ